MFIVGIHLLVGLIVAIFMIFSRRPQTYVELKEEKHLANGDLDASHGKSQQVCITESVRRYFNNLFKSTEI